MMATSSRLPRWLIHDEADRTFIAHTQSPRFFAELVDEVSIEPFVISLGVKGDLVIIEWIDAPVFDSAELIPSLIAVLAAAEQRHL